MLGIKHGYRTAKNCVPIRVTRLKNCVYIVVLTHVERIYLLSKLHADQHIKVEIQTAEMSTRD